MKHFATPLVAFLLIAGPLPAQEEEGGLSLMERGAQLFMEGIMKEMEPALEEFQGLTEQMAPALRSFADQMGPKLADLLEEVEDWSVYEAPEVLPNGDIIIRRKPDPSAPSDADESEPSPPVDL